VEYVFRNSVNHGPCTVSLGQFSLIIKEGDRERIVSYAGIRAVRLKRKGDLFSVGIDCESGDPIKITNRYYHTAERYDDYSPAYASFVRILHHHLHDKSQAAFRCGVKSTNLLGLVFFLMITSFGIAFLLEFFELKITTFWGQSIGLFSLLLIGILVMLRDRFPQSYDPENIPLSYLPKQNVIF
jgi:hypothetical protein